MYLDAEYRQREVRSRYQAAAEAGDKVRLDRLFGRHDDAAYRESQRANLKRAVDRLLSPVRRRELVRFRFLTDDGWDDRIWAMLNPRRQYRVRPWRSCDGEPVLHRGHCVTIIHLPSGKAIRGAPADALHTVGFPAQAEDSDQYGLLWALAEKASRGFRKHRPRVGE